MIHIKALLQTTAIIALVFGINPPDTDLNGEPFPISTSPVGQSTSMDESQSSIPPIETRTTAPDTALRRN
jgi:hypothetical protein